MKRTCVASRGELSERRECDLDGAELGPRDEATPKCLLCSLAEELGGESALGTVTQGTAGARCGNGAEPRSFTRFYVGVMEQHTGWHTQATTPPCLRQGEMDLCRQHVGETMQSERGGM